MPSDSAIGPESRLAVTTSRLISLETTMREQEQKSSASDSLALLKSVTVHPLQARSQSATYVPRKA